MTFGPPCITLAQQFLESDKNCTLLMIETKNAKDISGYTNFSNEKEIILKPGTQLRVEDNAFSHSDFLVVYLIKLDDDEVQLEKGKTKMKLSSKLDGTEVDDILI
jgi:hypothetical protein